jgi:transposase
MINNTSLGLKNVKITHFQESGGKLEPFLEKEPSSAICPNCHSPSTSIKDHEYYKILDKPTTSIPIQLVIKKRRFFCNNPYCSKKSFTEEISGLPKKSSYTQNFKDFLGELHWDMDYPTIKRHLARKYQLTISLSTIHRLLKEFLVKKFDLPPFSPEVTCKYVGLDEFSYAKSHCYAVTLINIDKRKIVNIVAGGKITAAAMAVLNSCDTSFVQARCIHMWPPFKIACYKKLPNADVVVDKFDVISQLHLRDNRRYPGLLSTMEMD